MSNIKEHITNKFLKMLSRISPTLNTKVQYYIHFHKKLNLKHPVTSNEKVLWLKLRTYYKNPLISQCADKYQVRQYVEKCGCSEILNPIYGIYETPEDIDWSKLPQKFVLKSTYYSSYNILVQDKASLDIPATMKEMKKWQNSTDHLIASEMQYDQPHKIICEHFIESANGGTPEDYKVYCCNGKPNFVMVCMGREKGDHPKFYYFDKEGNLQHQMTRDGLNVQGNFIFEKPQGWDKLFYYAEILTKPFPYVRCDFYLSEGKVYFGELTFTPAKGLDSQKLYYTDKLIGDMIQLPI